MTLMYFFFFQAEDGIRDVAVTGVQTCALPISRASRAARRVGAGGAARDETGLRALAGGAAVLRARHGGGECAPVRGDRGHRRGRVPEAPQSAAIISAPGFGR